MKEFDVTFKKIGLPWIEHNRVYAENHNRAKQVIREHYGRGTVSIISVRKIKEG